MSLGEHVLVLVVYALALARMTRLVNSDKITDFLRLYPAGKAREARLVADEAAAHGQTERARVFHAKMARWNLVVYYVQCPWCVGLWLTLASAWVPLFYPTNVVAVYLGVALAASHLIGVMSGFAETEDIDIEDDDAQ